MEMKDYEIFNNREMLWNLKANFLAKWRAAFRELEFKSVTSIYDGDVFHYTSIKCDSEFGHRLLSDYVNTAERVVIGHPHCGIFTPYNAKYEINGVIAASKNKLAKFLVQLLTGGVFGNSDDHYFAFIGDIAREAGEDYTTYFPGAIDAIDDIIESTRSVQENNVDMSAKICDVIENEVKRKLGSMSSAFDWALGVLELYFWNIEHDDGERDYIDLAAHYNYTHSHPVSEKLGWGRFTATMTYNSRGDGTKWLKSPRGISRRVLLSRAVYMHPASMYPKYRRIAE